MLTCATGANTDPAPGASAQGAAQLETRALEPPKDCDSKRDTRGWGGRRWLA
jgi:hypothetical protein